MTERPSEQWEGRSAEDLAQDWDLPAVHLFVQVGSTNDIARRLAASGAPSGTLVLAEQQLAGRGRVGRSWDSPAGLGLWFSMVVRPPRLPEPGALPLLVGLGVAAGLDPFCGALSTELKWPNDVLVAGRKLGGILCESAWERDRPSHVVAGVGLNLLHAPEDFPVALWSSATSLRIASGESPSRYEVATAVLRSLAGYLAGEPGLDAGRLKELEARDALQGREVVIFEPETGQEIERGLALGVSPGGALLLRTAAGVVRPIHSGTARLVGTDTK